MLEHYLQKSRSWKVPMYFHPYPAFGAFASASQVQLDVDRDRLIATLKAFSLLEPVKAVLFDNALMAEEPELVCVRDLFWENSTHGINPHNIGMLDCALETVDDLLEYICTTSIFCAQREGHYINFYPVPITDYLEQTSITGEYYADGAYHTIVFAPQPEDLACLRTYKFEDLTFRGTIEFRSVCCQPFSEAMTSAALHVGLMRQIQPLTELLEGDHAIYHHGYSATELRKIMNRRQWPEFVDRDGLRRLCLEVVALAQEGLRQRGLGEEAFLAPLYRRAENLCSPGREMLERMEAGATLQSVVERYAAFGDQPCPSVN
jgi:gamma-glutamylcysteine synthetase